MIKLCTESRGPILSASLDVGKAKAITALLNRSIGLLPQAEGDPIKPFATGICNDFETLRKPGTSASPLRGAIGAYTHSKHYLFACAQPDAFRHDIDGQPVEPVSESDRLAAQEAFPKLSKGLPENPPASNTRRRGSTAVKVEPDPGWLETAQNFMKAAVAIAQNVCSRQNLAIELSLPCGNGWRARLTKAVLFIHHPVYSVLGSFDLSSAISTELSWNSQSSARPFQHAGH